MTDDVWPNWPEHMKHDEYLRRRIRDVEASLHNYAEITFARLDLIEAQLGIEPGSWRKQK